MPGSQRENPGVANTYEHLLEQINYPYGSSTNPSQPYPLMPNTSPIWNAPLLSPQPVLSAQRTPPNLPHNPMNYGNPMAMHTSQYSVPYTEFENPAARFLRSSSDVGMRMNQFPSSENSPFSVDNFTSNMEALSPLFINDNPHLIDSSSISSMPSSIPQEYQINQFISNNESHNTIPAFTNSSPPQSNSETQGTSINKFHKLSLGTWVSPLQPPGNHNYPEDHLMESSTNSSSQPAHISPRAHCHPLSPGNDNSSFPEKNKKGHASVRPSYSDVLSKKASQEQRTSLNGFQPSYSKQNNILADSNSSHHKSRGDLSHKSSHSKKSKNASNNIRCNSPNTNVNCANVNTFNHGNKESAYSKVGLDRFDIPDNVQGQKSSLSYSYKSNLNCSSKTCNLDVSDKSLKKNSSSSHLSPVHSKRVSPPKNEKKNSGTKFEEASSVSEIEKISCDQLNNHVPFSQQKQTPKRTTSFINNNLSASNASINNIKSNNSSTPQESSQTKISASFSKEDLKAREGLCQTQTKFTQGDSQGCSIPGSSTSLKDSNSRPSGSSSRNNRVNSSNKDKVKESLGKKNSKKRKDNQSTFHHSELLMTGWSLLLVWVGVAARAGLWLFFLISDVIRMSSRLIMHMCLQILSSVKLQFLKIKAHTVRHGSEWMGYLLSFIWKNDRKPSGLETCIPLPTTGEEAMKRLLACRGKDPYSILGVTKMTSDDDIKKYYKRQAFLVHPDKNKQAGAEEAFKILAHAFEIIGEPSRRVQYDTKVAEEVQFEGAWGEMASLLTRLKEKIEEAANTICCTNCNRRHRRVKLPRPIYAARHCADCQIKHAAREGDIWAESCFFGLRWRYFACMEGSIYDISEWAACQRENLKHLQANTHSVQYRIVSGKKNANNKSNIPECPTDPELEEFFNNLCRERFRNEFVPPGQSNNADVRKRKGKKKK